MSILLQILIIVTILATFYALVVHNRSEVKQVVDILPDFSKLNPLRKTPFVKVIVFVPDSHSETVRHAIALAGGGRIDYYSSRSFSSLGMGRYVPEVGAKPALGTIGNLELVEEERIEATVSRIYLAGVIAAIKRVHPYEETVIDIYPLETIPSDH